MPINGRYDMELERKLFAGIEFKADKPGTFTARIATLKVIDKDGDVTLPGAFPQGKEILISAYQHGSWMGELPVGKGTIREEGDEVLVDGEFNLESDTGREHYATIKFAPDLQEWSYGFKVVEAETDTEWEGNHVWRIIKKVDVFEASPVLRGAGMNTATLAIKSGKEEGGMTYAKQADAVLAAADDFLDRTKSLADLRRQDGRTLSKASLGKVAALRKAIGEIACELERLETVPEEKSDAQKAEAKAVLESARALYNEVREEILTP